MKTVKIYVGNMPAFFEVVNACAGKVLITGSNGKSADLRNNDFLQELLMTAHNGNRQTQVDLTVENDEDFGAFLSFMLSDKIAS